MKITDNALAIMKERILHEDEAPADMVKRVASVVGGESEIELAEVMLSKRFLPNSPCLVNAGTEIGQLSACFVLPIDDSIESIMQTLYNAALVQKTGGGVGYNFSKLRGKGERVSTTNGEASGPVSFMRMFNATMEEIKQGGRRRGASLAVLNCDHPDILEFITAKTKDGDLNNFNISVGITDDFMRNPDIETWQTITQAAWETGEPGLLFLDQINHHNPKPELGRIEACNPCGESVLLPYESCVLGSINLAEMVTSYNVVDYCLLGYTVKTAVKFLNKIIDTTKFPLKEIEEATKRTRKIGLGIMGLADMLYKLRIPYDSDRGRKVAGEVMNFINTKARAYSEQEGYDNDVVTSIAPTGTISAIAGCSFGAEPNFALAYTKTILDGKNFAEVNPVFEGELKTRGIYSEELISEVAHNRGSCRGVKGIPADIQDVFVTAYDMSWGDHVKMQAELQQHVEQSISKTINLPESATVEDVSNAYKLAWQMGCKGATVYRDGSRQNQVLSVKHKPKQRPLILQGKTSKYKTGCGSLYITVNGDDKGEPHEVFINHSYKRGGCSTALLNSMARVVSIALRSGVDQSELSSAMAGQVCGECEEITSCADALGKAIMPMVCGLDGKCEECG